MSTLDLDAGRFAVPVAFGDTLVVALAKRGVHNHSDRVTVFSVPPLCSGVPSDERDNLICMAKI